MANEHQILARDYRIESEEIIKPIYTNDRVSQAFPMIQDLSSESLEVRYFKQVDDPQYRYNMEAEYALTHVGYGPTDTATPVITTNLHYGFDELARINNSNLPLDSRVAVVRQQISEAWNRVAFCGSTVANDDIAVTTVNGAGTQSTAWGATAFDVTSHASCIASYEAANGQLIDGLDELLDPQALIVTPDVYKLMRGLSNANTDLNTIDELNKRMKAVNAASPGVIMTKYLDATVARDHPGSYTVTAGTQSAALMNINSQYYRIHTSPLVTRQDPVSNISGLHIQLHQRFAPVFIKKEAIIYEATVTIT